MPRPPPLTFVLPFGLRAMLILTIRLSCLLIQFCSVDFENSTTFYDDNYFRAWVNALLLLCLKLD